ncbi:MAG: AAA family ATPase, partial [Planctomycetaceae bacterium]|nr:AAA family ATPase [Planctomycetaceae bacterium]
MGNVVRLAIVDPNDASRTVMKNLLLGIDVIWLEAECSRYEFFTDVASQTQPDIALISLDADPEQGLALVGKLNEELPSCDTLVVSSSQEGSLILQAMRNGAKEFLSYPLKLEEFLASLDRIRQSSGGRDGEGQVRSSQVITVAGVGGGVGCTSLAINIACSIAQDERNSVTVIDLDLALGDADVWLDIIPDYTIQDVAENISRLDYSLLKRSLTKHDCGAFLLPRPTQLDDATSITPDEFRRVIALLKATFTHLVIDISKGFGPLDMAALEVADSILLVTQLDLPCLRNVVRLLQYFDLNEGFEDKVNVVVNRFGLEANQISSAKALETIGREIFWQLPNEYATIVESRNNGVPLLMQAPKAKLTKSIDQLARSIDQSASGEVVSQEATTRKGLFGF